MMLLKLAWKNIWRNFTRSFLVIFSVTLGLCLGVFVLAFVNGLAKQRLAFQLENTIAHVKISHPEFTSEKEINFFIPEVNDIIKKIKKHSNITAISVRTNFRGTATNQQNTQAIDIYGIRPQQEKSTFGLYKFIKQGEYLNEKQHKTVVIGQRLATNLNLNLGNILEMSFQNLQGKLLIEKFKIVGIYQMPNTNFESSHIFIRAKDLQKIFNTNHQTVHQIALKLPDYKQAHSFAQKLKGSFNNVKVESWAEVAPDLAYIEVMMRAFFYVFMGIILLGVSLGIINTMLMTVLERSVELNMLKTIGMKPKLIFVLILLETFFLTLVGLPIGLFLAWFAIYFTGMSGIDLSYFSEGLAELGYNSMIYPHLSFLEYLRTIFLLCMASFLSALYPAWKAIKI